MTQLIGFYLLGAITGFCIAFEVIKSPKKKKQTYSFLTDLSEKAYRKIFIADLHSDDGEEKTATLHIN